MAPSPPQAPLQRRHDLNIVKQQLVYLVTIVATLFVLCPERLQLYRNLCVIPLLAYLTAITFDLVISLNEKWDNAPAVVKYFVPIQLPEISPPSEQFCRLVTRQIEIANNKSRHFFTHLRSILHTVIDWIFSQIGRGSTNSNTPGCQNKAHSSAPKPDKWVVVLVTTPIIQNENPFHIDTNTDAEIYELISWESAEVSSNLTVILSPTSKVQLTLCLIPKSIWVSRKTVLEKFKVGLYWNHRPGHSQCQGEQWDEETIRSISRIQFVGQTDEYNIDKVNRLFNSLRKGWNDVNSYWSDVDYAIIFAFLLVGTSSTDICKKMFDHFADLRVEQAQRNTDLNRSRAGAAILTLLTGGLAAPLTIPMMMGAGDAAMTMSANDRYLWGERTNMCKELLQRYTDLSAIIELKNTEAYASKPLFAPPACESSWFADDTW